MELTNIRVITKPLGLAVFVGSPIGGCYSKPYRTRYQLDYVKANQKWWIEVRFGSEADVAIFEKAVHGSCIRLVEFQQRFFIEDSRIEDSAGVDNASKYAEEELPRLNSAVRLLCPEYMGASISVLSNCFLTEEDMLLFTARVLQCTV